MSSKVRRGDSGESTVATCNSLQVCKLLPGSPLEGSIRPLGRKGDVYAYRIRCRIWNDCYRPICWTVESQCLDKEAYASRTNDEELTGSCIEPNVDIQRTGPLPGKVRSFLFAWNQLVEAVDRVAERRGKGDSCQETPIMARAAISQLMEAEEDRGRHREIQLRRDLRLIG